MAGGSGTRFWPYSTPKKPKQFLDLTGNGTMLQMTVDRLKGLAEPENIWVITGERFIDLVSEQCPTLPKKNIVGEPMPRDTSGAIALAAGLVQAVDKDSTMVVLPADHVINDKENFQKNILEAVKVAKQNKFVTIGVPPTYPAEIYGYLHCKDQPESGNAFSLESFIEKPSKEKAESYLRDGSYFWNAGMFIWKTDLLMKALEKFLPEHAEMAIKLGNAYGQENWSELASQTFEPLEKISIDFGLMEKIDDIAMVKATFDWNDVGGWLALVELLGLDENKNSLQGINVTEDISNNIIITQNDSRPTLVKGISDCIIVNANAGTLVCNRNDIEKIKPLIEDVVKKTKKCE